MATLLLLGLDDSSAETIAKLTVQAGHSARREPMRTIFETRPREDVVVVSGDQSTYREAILSLKQFRATTPVVVVSRLGETSEWLDAMELGASEFLAAPYTLAQIHGVIRAAMALPKSFAA